MGWLDVLIIVILAINGIKGWGKGFVLSFFSMISIIIAGYAAKMYHPAVSKYLLENHRFFIGIQKIIGARVKEAIRERAISMGSSADSNIFEVMKFPKMIGDLLMRNEAMRGYSQKAMEGIQGYIADALTRIFIDLLSIIIIFVLVQMLLGVIAHIFDGVARLPVLRQFNTLGGIAFGVIKGLLIVFIILTLMTPVTTMDDDNIITEGIEDSTLGKFFYHYNPILYMFKTIQTYGEEEMEELI